MPRKPNARPAGDVTQKAVEAALKLAAERPWHKIALADIAAEAGLGLIDLYRELPSKPAILRAFARRADEAVLAAPGEAGASPRERLFDVLMHRFEALAPHRPALRALAREVRCGRLEAAAAGLHLPCSMAWMLEAAGLGGGGLQGLVRVKALSLAYLGVMRVFLEDETPDLARTMASLDRALRRAAPFLRFGPEAKPEEAAA
jgi:AcrR family transcriptional regulator